MAWGYLYYRIDKAGLINLTLLALLCLLFHLLGDKILRRLGFEFRGPAERIAFSLPAGMLAVSLATFGLGIAGLLYPFLFRGMVLAAFIALRRETISLLRTTRVAMGRLTGIRWQSALACFAMAVGFLCYLVPYLIAALAPEIEYDALNYHLGLLRLYVSEKRIFPVHTNFYAGFPAEIEMLYLFGWLVKDVYLGKLFHLLCGALLALALFSFGRRYFGPRVGPIAALIFYSSPLVAIESKSAYIDLGLSLYGFLSIYALANWHYEKQERWLYLSALMAGAAMAAKYTGVAYLVIPLLLISMKGIASKQWSGALKSLAGFLLVALLPLAPWLIRNYFFFQNPLFPFFNGIFQNPYMSSEMEHGWIRQVYHWEGFERTAADYLSLPLEFTIRGYRFQGIIGPVFLLLPMVLVVRGWSAALWLAFGSAFFVSLPWIMGNPLVRFALPALSLFSLLIAWGMTRLYRINKLACAAAAAVVIAGAALGHPLLIKSWHKRWLYALTEIPIEFVLGEESRPAYIERWISSYPVFQYIDRALPARSRILSLHEPYQLLTDRLILSPATSESGGKLLDTLFAGVAVSNRRVLAMDVGHGQAARYIKLVQTGENPGAWWSIHEIKVYSSPDTELPLDSKCKATSNFNAKDAALAFDAKLSTRWGSKHIQQPGMYFILDLGARRPIRRVTYISSPSDFGAGHRLELSDDNNVWRETKFELIITEENDLASVREALIEVKRRGAEYIMFNSRPEWGYHPITQALKDNAQQLGLDLLFQANDNFLYAIDD